MTHPDDALMEAPDHVASAAAAQSPGPPPSSETPGPVQEPPERTGSDTERPDPDKPPLQPAEFDARWRQPFTGLIYLGALTEEHMFLGHHFKISTPSQAEKIQLGLLHAPYAGTMAAEIAYQTLTTAAFLVSVDDHQLPQPVLNDRKDDAVRERYKWVAENLRQPVIDEIFGWCVIMDATVMEVMEAMKKAWG